LKKALALALVLALVLGFVGCDSSDGGVIIFVSDRDMAGKDENWDIYSIKPDGEELTCLTKHGANDRDPIPSPDGSKIAYRSDRSGEDGYLVMDRDGSNQKLLVEISNVWLIWAPDSSKLVYELEDDIYVVGVDGSEAVNLTSELDAESYYTNFWSPDSKKIAFMVRVDSPNGTARNLYVVGADGSGLTKIAEDVFYTTPYWSPDSSKIAFSVPPAGNVVGVGDIYVVDADGSNELQLTDGGHACSFPMWSPDSKTILYHEYDAVSAADIWVVNVDGTDTQRLTDDDSGNGETLWSPDGRKIVYTSHVYEGSEVQSSSLIFMNADGGDKTTIMEEMEHYTYYSLGWSKDEKRLMCGTEGKYYSMDANGGDLITLEPKEDFGGQLIGWSPDGRSLLYAKTLTDGDKDNPELFILNADGMTNITNDSSYIYQDSSPVWSQ